MDWLLTVPLLSLEIPLVMDLTPRQHISKAWLLGLSVGLMIVTGYCGELVVTGDPTPPWVCWVVSMVFFLYIVQELMVGLSEAAALMWTSSTSLFVEARLDFAKLSR